MKSLGIAALMGWLLAVAPGAIANEPESAHTLDPSRLIGKHPCRGKNPDGSVYEGEVDIRFKKDLLLLQWNIGGQLSYGTGLLEGMTLGVGLENGVAIYQIVPQASGFTLLGMWAKTGPGAASEEVILIGDTDVESARFPVEKINGSYRVLSSESPEKVTISGGDFRKTVTLQTGADPVKAEGLLLGSGLALITPEGLAVLQIQPNESGELELTGRSVTGKGQISALRLEPVKGR